MASKHLHEELVVEILARLSVKSLVRFKCLSKSYRALITNQSFITNHFSCSTSAAKNHPSLLIFHFRNKFSITLVSDDELSQPPIDLEPSLPVPEYDVDNIIPYGPCNGIFCLNVSPLYSPDQLMLWNPATREVKVLPLPHQVDSSFWEFFVHGFGVDPRTNDYKVVSILTVMDFHKEKGRPPCAEVYNLSTNSWKMIDVTVPAYSIIYPMFSSYLNGVYHWLTKCHDDESILCFDMSDDVFWKMKLPPVSQDYANEQLMDSNVAVLDDSIAYVKEYRLSSPLGTRVEIWVMNEYRVEATWTKRFNIGPHLERWKFWGFWKDGEVLLSGQDYKPLVSYNLNIRQPVQDFPIHVGPVMFQAFRYVESIVPLSALVEEEA